MPFDPNDPDTKAAITAAIEDAVSGLKAKNSDLLGKIVKLQKDSKIDPADYQAAIDELEKTQAELDKANKALKEAKTEADQHKTAFETESNFSRELLVDNGLTEALLKVGIKPELAKAVKAMLAGQVDLSIDGEKRIAKIGDKPLADYIGEWAKSDEGKHFVAAPDSRGGGARGGGPGAQGDALDKMSPEARLAAINAEGQAA